MAKKNPSDSLYHRLFSHPLMVEHLVRDFVPEVLAEGVDFTRMQRVNSKFHARRGRRREGDIIWRLPMLSGTDIYLYVMIEFQSKIDCWMAIRTQVYTGLLWQEIIYEKKLKKCDKLPPLLPIVLYNSNQRWCAPLITTKLVELPPGSRLWPWQPQVCYYLLDEGAFPGDTLAACHDSLAALLFRLERCHDPATLTALVTEAIGWFRQHPGYEELKLLLTELIQQAADEPKCRTAGMVIPNDILEGPSMLAGRMGEWVEQWFAEGMAKGLADGEARGMALGEARGVALGEARGKAEIFLRLLRRRFGPLDNSTEARIYAADSDQLDTWSERIFDATALTDIFTDPQLH